MIRYCTQNKVNRYGTRWFQRIEISLPSGIYKVIQTALRFLHLNTYRLSTSRGLYPCLYLCPYPYPSKPSHAFGDRTCSPSHCPPPGRWCNNHDPRWIVGEHEKRTSVASASGYLQRTMAYGSHRSQQWCRSSLRLVSRRCTVNPQDLTRQPARLEHQAEHQTAEEFVRQDPFTCWELGNDGHARTESGVLVIDIIDDWAPVEKISRGLVDHFLSKRVIRIALVRVVENQLALVDEHKWLPYRFQVVLWQCLTTPCNAGYKAPCESVKSAGMLFAANKRVPAAKSPMSSVISLIDGDIRILRAVVRAGLLWICGRQVVLPCR
ncbi:hypothetical protein KC321_g36 [Hortaea werneckii]|nr:hypothetical protein KC321_g36 [Hortaea werneckii]